MTAPSALKPPHPISGLRRPPSTSSSPSGKGDRDTQQAKKKEDSYLSLARRLNGLCAKHGNIHISDLKNNCYLVRFRSQEDYEWAITGGPWMLGDTYLTVHRWFKGFDLWTTKVTTTVSVELLDLPIEFYNPEAVMRIASRIGKLVRVVRATEAGARGKYAHVCVEVDLSKRLLPKYKVEGVPYLIVYEGFHKICTKCGMYDTPTHLCKCDHPREEDMMINDTTQVQKVNDPSNRVVYNNQLRLSIAGPLNDVEKEGNTVIIYVVGLRLSFYYQKCHDPDCQG
ncbi:hypothetical protein LINGRAHAP2_LOCUS26460 [Linum grandiflorum]